MRQQADGKSRRQALGGLLGLASVASVVFFRRVWKGRWSALLGPIDRPAARALGGFALMAVASAVV